MIDSRLGAGTVHLLGIGGTAMASLAGLLKQAGVRVSGSDQNIYPPMSDQLAAEQIPVRSPYSDANIPDDCSLVVVGNAISRGNPELEAVLDTKLPYVSMPELLKAWFIRPRTSVVIAGTHGKTTTSSLVSWGLDRAGVDPGFLIGGIPLNLGVSFRQGSERFFVVEGDEYDTAYFDKGPKFLHYLPDILVIGNVEFDHADIYRDFDDVMRAFRLLVRMVPRGGLLVAGVDSEGVRDLVSDALCDTETYSVSDGIDATWSARTLRSDAKGSEIRIWRKGAEFLTVDACLWGAAGLKNLLAATAVFHRVGMTRDQIRDSLATFLGVRRRLETRGQASGVTVVDDFAHHPTAVAATIEAARERFGGARLFAVFEPRSFTARSRRFQDEFASALAMADRVIVSSVFHSERLSREQELNVEELAEAVSARGVRARTFAEVDSIVGHLAAETRDGDVVVVMSNGAFGNIHEKLLAALKSC